MSDSCDTMDYTAHQLLLSMGFPRHNGLPFPFPGDLPNPAIELWSPALAGRVFTIEATWEAQLYLLEISKSSIVFAFVSCLDFGLIYSSSEIIAVILYYTGTLPVWW